MKAPRFFKPHNALADRLNDRRGVDALTATTQATAAIQRIEPIALAEVDRSLAILTQDLAAHRASDCETMTFESARIYAAADTLAGLAPAFGLPRLGEAAASLCKLISEDGNARPAAIVVHIEALILIRQGDSMGEFVLPGLQRVSSAMPSEARVSTTNATRPQALSQPADRAGEIR